MNKFYLLFLLAAHMILSGCEKEVDLLDSGSDTFYRIYGNGILDGQSNSTYGMVLDDKKDIIVISTILTQYGPDEENSDDIRGIYIFKTDSRGYLKQELVLNDSVPMEGRDIIMAEDGGFYILGYKNRTVQLTEIRIQPYLAKLSQDLTLTWENDTIDILPTEIEVPKSMTLTSQGEIIVMGNFIDPGSDSSAFVASFDSQGQLLRKNTVPDTETNILLNVSLSKNIIEGQYNNSNRYVMCFNDLRSARSTPVLLTLETQDLGLNDAPFFGSEEETEVIREIQKYGLDNYLMVGSSRGTTNNSGSILLYRISPSGSLIWKRTYGLENDPEGGSASYDGLSVCESPEGGFIILGTKVKSNNDHDFFLVKTDGSGSVQWVESLGGQGLENGVEITSVSDGYIILGTSEIASTKLITLLKTDLKGRVIK